MRRIFGLVLAALLWLPSVAVAQHRSVTITLCSAETGTGICDNAAGNDLIATTAGYSTLNFNSVASTGTYSCNIYSGNKTDWQNYTGDLSATGSIVSPAPLSPTLEQIGFAHAAFYMVWINCTSPGTVTITVQMQE